MCRVGGSVGGNLRVVFVTHREQFVCDLSVIVDSVRTTCLYRLRVLCNRGTLSVCTGGGGGGEG